MFLQKKPQTDHVALKSIHNKIGYIILSTAYLYLEPVYLLFGRAQFIWTGTNLKSKKPYLAFPFTHKSRIALFSHQSFGWVKLFLDG